VTMLVAHQITTKVVNVIKWVVMRANCLQRFAAIFSCGLKSIKL